MAMVKALAYGTDAVSVSLGLQDSGIDYLGVASVDEGVALRQAGVNLPILVMLSTEEELDKLFRNRLTPSLYSPSMVKAVISYAKSASSEITVHLEVDTGMHRTGLSWDSGNGPIKNVESAAACLEQLAQVSNIQIEGIMTHLACADEPEHDDFTRQQFARFKRVAEFAQGLELEPPPLRHIAATAGTVRFPEARKDMVRVGAALFGFHPPGATSAALTLTPAVSLVSSIVQVIDIPEGEGVGYGITYVAPEGGGRVGVVPVGFHDCVPRSFSNFGSVVVSGVRCPVVGAVSMDSLTVDLSACSDASVGSDVLIYGKYGGSEVSMEEVSRAIGTIPYELMARVGPRVQRIFSRH